MIIFKPGKINDYLHMIDLFQFGRERTTTAFIGVFENGSVIFDCGCSDDIRKIITYARKTDISLSSVKYIVISHHHYDHAGGLWKLLKKVKKFNPAVKIICSQQTMELYNNFMNEPHFLHAKKNFPGLIGTVKQINESNFEIVELNNNFSKSSKPLTIMDQFELNNSKIELGILKTPGHTHSHISPVLLVDEQVDFIYSGEAIGCLFNIKKLETLPSSMVPYFNYGDHMESVIKLKEMNPPNMGFGHFGVVTSEKDVQEVIEDHYSMMSEFRSLIIKYFQEKQETKYVFDKIFPFLRQRSDFDSNYMESSEDRKMLLGVVYGMMVYLGYRKL